MGFLLYQLAKNPDKQAALREEVERVVGDKTKPVTAKALNSLSYLKACVRESMRIAPVVSGIIREFSKDVVIRDYLLPKGVRYLLESTRSVIYCARMEERLLVKPCGM